MAQCVVLLGAAWLGTAGIAHAGSQDQAYKLFSRINSVPPPPATLAAMAAKIGDGDLTGAALDAINDPSGNFYNLTLVDMVSRWTNILSSSRVDLNDFTATVIGMIRDDVPFNTVLSADVVYIGDSAKVSGLPPYSLASNAHYQALSKPGVNLKETLLQQKQSAQPAPLPTAAIAGVISTRGFGAAFFKAGTNRRAAAFTMQNFLCHQMTQLSDTTRSDFRVRQDVTRAPGGDSQIFRNKCAGCHAGMDPLTGAFAYYDIAPGKSAESDALIYTPGKVAAKYLQNAEQFPTGYVTVDDSWQNNWREGQNAALNWGGAAAGNGANSWGSMITGTAAFSTCMAIHAITTMCLHAPTSDAELRAVNTIAAAFAKDFNMKYAFAQAAVACVTP